jgi:hypothetical protein
MLESEREKEAGDAEPHCGNNIYKVSSSLKPTGRVAFSFWTSRKIHVDGVTTLVVR